MEKHKRFMAELRSLLGRYGAALAFDDEEVCVTYLDEHPDEQFEEYPVHTVLTGLVVYTAYGWDRLKGKLAETGDPNWREIPEGESGMSYMHCGLCLTEWKSGEAGETSPRDYAQQQGSWTKLGFQLWCSRHDVNILHVDFNGQKMRGHYSTACECWGGGRVTPFYRCPDIGRAESLSRGPGVKNRLRLVLPGRDVIGCGDPLRGGG